MKRFSLICICILLMLTGCGAAEDHMEQVLLLRERIILAEHCSFDTTVTVDFGEELFSFKMHCVTNSQGEMVFTILEPDSIAGVEGIIQDNSAGLKFEEQILQFKPLADGMITPVCAPWVLLKAIRSGYIHGCGVDGDLLEVLIDDSYEENELQLSIWLDRSYIPAHAEIYWSGRLLIALQIHNFTYV